MPLRTPFVLLALGLNLGRLAAQSTPTELFQTPLYNDPSLVSYWRFEGNSNDSKGVNNGTNINVVYSTANGKFGQGVGFNGSGSRIVTQSAVVSDSLTWSLWVYLTSLPSASTAIMPIAQTDTAGGLGRYLVIFGDGSVRFTSPPGLDNLTVPGIITAGAWHHLAVTVGSVATDIHIYVNGIDRALTSNGSGSPPTGSFPYTIGAGGDSPFLNLYWWPGNIDDLAIFARALTATEISNLYATNSERIQLLCRPGDPVQGQFGSYVPLIVRHCYFLATDSTGQRSTYSAFPGNGNAGKLTPVKNGDLINGEPKLTGGCTGPPLGTDCINIPILRTQSFTSIVQGLEQAVSRGSEDRYDRSSNNSNTWTQRRIDELHLAVTLPPHVIANDADLCREIDSGYLTGVLQNYGVAFYKQVILFYYGLFKCAF